MLISIEDDVNFKFEDAVMQSGYMFVINPSIQKYTITIDEFKPKIINQKQWPIDSLEG